MNKFYYYTLKNDNVKRVLLSKNDESAIAWAKRNSVSVTKLYREDFQSEDESGLTLIYEKGSPPGKMKLVISLDVDGLTLDDNFPAIMKMASEQILEEYKRRKVGRVLEHAFGFKGLAHVKVDTVFVEV